MKSNFVRLLDHVTLHARRGDPDSVLQAVDSFAVNERLMHIGPLKGALVDREVSARRPRRILELGSFFGYSAVRMARLLPPGGELITVDLDADHHAATCELIEYAGLADRVRAILAPAGDVIAQLDGSFDVVFIDHYARYYLADLSQIEKRGLLRPGALVMADNVVMFESLLSAFLRHVRDGDRYHSTLHPVGCDGLELSIWQGPDASTRQGLFPANHAV